MKKPSGRTMLVISTVLGLMMTVSGLTKLVGESHQVAMFTMVGLPSWFLALVGTFEVIGGILLLVPATTPIGSLILSTIMVGALWAHAAQADWINLLPVSVLLSLFLVIFRRNRSRAVQLLEGV
jgi:uncharacterized membrane protein YphA (DoxX/SURF4 family)